MKKADMMIGIYILAAIVFLIVPIPTQLLDVLMALNIAVSLIIMFNALFSKEALDMSTFPSILLFTTVFRISLNVSSTRNILTKGYAGGVVAAFGEFVGGGDMNGIGLLLSQTTARLLFGALLVFHVLLFCKIVLPAYKKSFET